MKPVVRRPVAHRKERVERPPALSFFIVAAVAAIFLAASVPAHAVPSFARQTGLQCGACHTAYPQLNEFGRTFKLNSYSIEGGDSKLPRLAFMAQPSFTHTEKSQSGGAAPHFNANDNGALSQASIFYGGKIVGNLGAFSQFTYNGVSDRFAIDNTDIRWSGTSSIAGSDVVYGITLNNNPTVEDLWNSTPAWGFPFASSDLAPGPAASTLIDGGLAQQVAGLGGYALWNDMIYAQIAGYRSLSAQTQTMLGVSPAGEAEISQTMPYWRLALQHTWGNHYLSGGTFGLIADTFPGRVETAGTDRRRDLGLDAQYQYTGDKSDLSVLVRWVDERADWNASLPLTNTSNAHDTLRTLSATVSYLYDKTYGVDLGYVGIRGNADAALYGSRTGSPDTNQFVVQFDYLPFNRDGGPALWQWFNPKLILQYTAYSKFDGSHSNFDGNGRNASDNNTLYAMVWLPF